MTEPNIIVILADDLGFSDLGCYGGEISTPNLDRLGRSGVRLSQFYNTARCSPSRASLLTGRDPHETGIGILTEDDRPHGYPGTMSAVHPTMAERFQAAGYATCLSGKWHLSSDTRTPNNSWPTRRGFDEFYGILPGADDYFHPRNLTHGEQRQPVPTDDYYFTDAISDHAANWVREQSRPFFLYLAYTAPHWPLHAREEDIAEYADVYTEGWDALREKRMERIRAEGLLDPDVRMSEPHNGVPPWSDAAHPEWEARRMSVYAAQVTAMDRGIGRVLDALAEGGKLHDTLVLFLADNGGCAEDLPPDGSPRFRQRQPTIQLNGEPMKIGNTSDISPGDASTFASYGPCWSTLSNTPFRYHKRWTHEGGIASPFIAHWPGGLLADGSVRHHPFQLTDILPTVLDAAGVPAPEGRGISMLPALRGGPESEPHRLYWEHIGNGAIRDGDWKLVRTAEGCWELYDLSVDRTELDDRAGADPERVAALAQAWQEWADRVGVLPWPAWRSGDPTPEAAVNQGEREQ
ncbi:arylsulfatase [Streptosporangium canum]|uniref:arylsulfatase n=1 Tax=Streptosporangium canum TaxID=324952 RepID=UPI0036A92960